MLVSHDNIIVDTTVITLECELLISFQVYVTKDAYQRLSTNVIESNCGFQDIR